MERTEILLVPLHPSGRTLSRSHCRIICDLIAVIMGSEIQFYKLGQLTDGRRHVSIESETADIDKGNSTVAVKRHSRLVSPEVRILVEVPVRTWRIILAYIPPVLTMKRLPYLIKGIIVLDIFVAFIKSYRYISICSLIVLDNKFRIDSAACLKETA